MNKYLQKLRYAIKQRIFASRYAVGAYTYGVPTVYAWGEGAKLVIGKFCSISSNVEIFLGGEHRTDWVTTYPFNIRFRSAKSFKGHPMTRGAVIIGNDVWIASGVKILSGVTVGDGAVIGAGAVVTSNVPAYAIAAGNPSRIVRYRFDTSIINQLLLIKWWDWSIEKIERNLPLMLSNDIDKFIHTHRIS